MAIDYYDPRLRELERDLARLEDAVRACRDRSDATMDEIKAMRVCLADVHRARNATKGLTARLFRKAWLGGRL